MAGLRYETISQALCYSSALHPRVPTKDMEPLHPLSDSGAVRNRHRVYMKMQVPRLGPALLLASLIPKSG